MGECWCRRGKGPVLLLVLCAATTWAADTPAAGYSALSNTLVERARNEMERIRVLVDQGTLPKVQLEQAQERLADAEDDAVLARTLYGEVRVADMTPPDAQAMLAAAQRRVERQAKIVAERQKLLDTGILAKSDLTASQEELESRRRVLSLAQNRLKLLDDLKQMAENEQRLEQAATAHANAGNLKNVMIRYEGNGLFDLSELPTISSEFEKRFHHALPVSALGQTLLHRSMGLDHRNRVDVALNPDQTEGVWLRQLLEKLHIPYLAFRGAVSGAATAPHIHIGTGSSRLKLASR
jgi:hypothetical protein